MSLHILATGPLVADPVRRHGAKAAFATATLRVATEDGAILVSVIAFGDAAELLLNHHQGDALAVSGRAKLSAWMGRDGHEAHGLSVVVEQVASAASARRADTQRRRDGAAKARPSRETGPVPSRVDDPNDQVPW